MRGLASHDGSVATDPATNTVTIPALQFTFDFCVIAQSASTRGTIQNTGDMVVKRKTLALLWREDG